MESGAGQLAFCGMLSEQIEQSFNKLYIRSTMNV